MPPMEPPHSDAAYASSGCYMVLLSLWDAVSTAMDGAALTRKVALGLLVLVGNLTGDPKRALS